MKKSKKLLSILLACLMIVSMFPAAAFADDAVANSNEKTIYVSPSGNDSTGTGEENSPYATLDKALSAAQNGNTIKLAAGEYTTPENRWSGVVVNIEGASKASTIIKGALWMGAGTDDTIVKDVASITVSDVTFKNTTGSSNWSNTGLGFSRINDCTINVKDCAVDGFQHGIHMNGTNPETALNIEGCSVTNAVVGISAQLDPNGAKLNVSDTVTVDGSAYAVQAFGTSTENSSKNYHYTNIDAYQQAAANFDADTGISSIDNSSLSEDDYTDGTTVTGNVVTSLDELKTAISNIDAAVNPVNTIIIGADIALDENGLDGTKISGKTLTIIGNGHTLSFAYDQSNSKMHGVFGNDTNPLYANTNLTVKNLVIKNTGTQGGYASVIGYNATGAKVSYEDCTFDNLYASVYVNPINNNDDNVSKDDVSLSISGCTFVKTQYGYAVDTTSGLPSKIDVTFDNNTGDLAENEPVTGVVYATINENETVGAFDTIQAALDAVVNNGTVTITPGTYTGDITIRRNIENLTITGEDGAIIKNGSLTVATNGIQLPGLTIENLAFENANIQMSPNGDSDLSGLTIRNNTFTGAKAANLSAIHLNLGSKATDGSGAAYDGLTITGNTIKNIKKDSSSGILIIGDGKIASDVTITNNTIDGVGWNGIQLNNMLGKAITVTGNDIRNCGATDPDGVINLYHSKANSFKINENKIIVGEGQLGVSNISDDVNLNRNYWGTPNPDFDKLLGYTEDTAAVEVDEFYRAESMQPEDLNTYEPPYTGKFSHEIFTKVGDNGTIDVDRYATEGDKVTITVSPDEAYMLDEMTVTSGGKDVEVTDNGDGTYTFTMPSGDVKIEVTFAEDPNWEPEPEEPAMPFVDVNEGDWFYDVVLYAYENGLMTGTSADTFAPNTATTRGMIVSMLARLEGVTSAESAGFTDVADNDWYATAVNWAASEGIVNGFEDDTFRPNDAITREQMAAILYNYADYKGYDVSARADLSDYADAESISSWAEDVLAWANAEGLINGMTATTIDPQGATTRAQTAAMFERFLTAHAE